MAAATAAVVAVAATAAATAYKASQSGGSSSGGLAGAGYVAAGNRERLFNRGTVDILDAERLILDDALAQGKQLEPSMYEALGLEPVYDRPQFDSAVAALSRELEKRQTSLNALRMRETELRGLKGKKAKKAKAGKELAKINKEQARLNKEIPALTAEVERQTAVGRKVVGFKPKAGIADPTGSAGNAFGAALDEFNSHLDAALAGKEPLDPTLKSGFDERERTLRERLRRQMGPDYETSTAGEQALANFDRERSEAYAAYNHQAIQSYSRLAEGRAGALQELTSGRLRNLAFPATFRAALGRELDTVAQSRLQQRAIAAEERGARGGAAARLADRKAARAAAANQARADALANVLAGVGSAAGTAGDYASRPTSPSVNAGAPADTGGGMTLDAPGGATGYSVSDTKVQSLLGR